MKWFRFYSEAMHDPKVQHLRPELFKFWVNLLCLANEQPERGSLPTLDEIAYILRMKRPVVHRFCVELVVAGLIHRRDLEPSLAGHWPVTDRSLTGQWDVTTRFIIHQWSVRQPPSDNVASRVKKYRQRTSDPSRSDDVTLHVTPGRVTCNGPERELDSEREKNPPPREAPPRAPSPGILSRSGDDLASLDRAIEVLASDLRTEHLAADLGRQHNTATNIRVPGWKWLRAARAILGPSYTDGQRGRFAYFASIARNLADSERDERKPRRETYGERLHREQQEAWRRSIAEDEAGGATDGHR